MARTALRRGWMSRLSVQAAGAALVLALLGTQAVYAQTFNVVYTFTGTQDGGSPFGGLVRDHKGNLYGTTTYGGAFGNAGTVFRLTQSGKETVLYNFCSSKNCKDGAFPAASLVRDSTGTLYGTAFNGGLPRCPAYSGCGTVFKMDKAGKVTVLHRFCSAKNCTDGSLPSGSLIRDAEGNLYGTGSGGGIVGGSCGQIGCGVVFKLDKTGKETVLHRFTGSPNDGQYPLAGLVRDRAGNLYGTTIYGGPSGSGTVFKVNKLGRERVLYSFSGGADGQYPVARLVRDAVGNLYGTTRSGGDVESGAIFELDSTGEERVLYSFTGGTDGWQPLAGLVRDSSGNLYGTTAGTDNSNQGTVFKLDTNGMETAFTVSLVERTDLDPLQICFWMRKALSMAPPQTAEVALEPCSNLFLKFKQEPQNMLRVCSGAMASLLRVYSSIAGLGRGICLPAIRGEPSQPRISTLERTAASRTRPNASANAFMRSVATNECSPILSRATSPARPWR